MPFTPDPPFPKTSGNPIRSKDWNDAIAEVQRLDTVKTNRAGDTFTGPLTVQAGIRVQGNFSMGGNGPFQVDAPNVVGGRFTIADAGVGSKVGINQPNPGFTLDVNGTLQATGAVYAGNSELHFTKTDHNWNASSDQLGYATIQNGANYNALMIVGRTVSVNPMRRVVAVWDELNVHGPLNADSAIASPMFGVQHVLNNRAGALPLSATFVTGGGAIVLFASGSGWWPSGGVQIGMLVRVYNVDRAWVMSFTNEQGSHKTFSSNPIVIAGLGGGTHSLQLVARAGTSTDYNDFFSVTVLELPFTGVR